MEVVESLLSALEEELREESCDQVKVQTLVQNLEAHLFSDLDAVENENAASLLFQSGSSSTSMLSLLRDTMNSNSPSVVKGKMHMCKCLGRFIKERHSSIVSLVGPFLTELLSLYKGETASSVQTKAHLLLPLKEVLKVVYKSKSVPESEQSAFCVAVKQALPSRLKELYDMLFSVPFSTGEFSKKPNGAAKANMFTVTGLLYANFPTDSASLALGAPGGGSSSIMKACALTLRQEFEKGQSDDKNVSNMELVAGVLSCLDRMLFSLELRSQKELSETGLWNKLLQLIKLIDDEKLSRYRVSRKALRLIKNHSDCFSKVIKGPGNAVQAFDILRACHEMHKETLRKHDEGAMISLLKEMGNIAIKDNDALKVRELIVHIKGRYLGLINFSASESGSGPPRQLKTHVVLLAVRGLATIAPAIAKLEQLQQQQGGGSGGAAETGGIVKALLQAASMSEFLQDQPTSSEAMANTAAGGGTSGRGGDRDQRYGNGGAIYGLSINSAMTKTVYFLLAVGGTIASSNAVCGPEVLDYVKSATQDVIQSYLLQPPTLQVLSRRALCLVSQGLAKRSADKNATVAQAGLLVEYFNVVIPSLLLQTISRTVPSSAANGPEDSVPDSEPDKREQDQPDHDDDDEGARTQDMLFGNGRMVGKYLSLWTELLVPEDPELRETLQRNIFDYATEVAPRILTRLFAETISTLRSLNLGYDSSLQGSEDLAIPNNPIDHDLLLNLTTFYHQVLVVDRRKLDGLGINSGPSSEWLRMLVRECVERSEMYPLVSALYRLIRSISSISLVRDSETASILTEYFLRLEPKLMQFTDELLEAVLAMLLDAPRTILPFESLVPSLVVSFTTGKQILLAVETLERRLFDGDEVADLDEQLQRLLPLLDSHLTVAGSHADKAKGTIKVGNSRSSRTGAKQQQQQQQLVPSILSAETSRAILRLLGRLGGHNQYILCAPQEAVQSSLSWSSTESIVLKLPIDTSGETFRGGGSSNIELTLTLDCLLPRVVELCSASNSDSSLRVTAAESLHALILFMLGDAKQSTSSLAESSTSKFAPIYEKVFPAIIEMAAGTGVPRTLFERLLEQLVVWFAGHSHVHTSEVVALVEALVAGLCDANSGGLREICARSIASFYKFAVKQGSKKQIANNEGTSDALISRLFSLCAHPAEDVRMGAAIALGRMYTFLREESSHIHLYAMQVVKTLLFSMRLGGSSSFLLECARVVKHYSNILFKSLTSRSAAEDSSQDLAQLFANSEKRSFPHSLAELVEWLWEGMGAPIKLFRRTCMVTFARICPLLMQHQAKLKFISSQRDNTMDRQLISEYFKQHLRNKPKALVQNLETDTTTHDQLVSTCPGWNGLDSGVKGKQVNSWLQQLSASLDAYIWLVHNKFLPLEVLFPTLVGDSIAATKVSTGKRLLNDSLSQNAFSSSVILDCISSFASVSQQDAFIPAPPSGISKELLLLASDIEESRQEVLEKSLWFLSECLKSSVQSDVDNKRVVGLQGTGLSGALVRLVRKSKVWAAPFQSVLLRYLLATSSAATAAATDSSKGKLRSKDIPKMAEEFLTFLPLLDEGLGGAMDVEGSEPFLQILTTAVNAVVDRLSKALEAKESATILGFSRTLNLLLRLQQHSELEGKPGILSSIWGEQYKTALHTSASRLVFAVASMVLNADPMQLDCGKECLVLALEMGFPFVFLVTEDSPAPSSQYAPSITTLLLNDATTKSSVQSLVKFVDQYGDLLAHQLLELHFKKAVFSGPGQTQLVSAVCASGESGLPVRLFTKVLAMAVLQPPAAWQVSLVMACVGNFSRLSFDALVLLLELDSKAQASKRNAELLHFVQREILDGLSGSKNLVQQLKLLPFAICGTVRDCARPVSKYQDDTAFTQQLFDAIEKMIVDKFPMHSRVLESRSSSAKVHEFSVLFHAYLDAISATGSVLLIRALIPSLSEGNEHLYFASIEVCFAEIVVSIAFEEQIGSTMAIDPGQNFVRGCLDLLLDNSVDQLLKFKMNAKQLLLTSLCLPALRRLTPARLVDYACMSAVSDQQASPCVVKKLVDCAKAVVPSGLTAQEADSFLITLAASFNVLETFFDLCPLQALRKEVNEVFSAPLLATSLKGKELGVGVLKAAHSAMRHISSGLAQASITAKQQYQSSSFCCLAVVMAKTQEEEVSFEKLVLCPSDTEIWSWKQVVEDKVSLQFKENVSFDVKIVRGNLCSELEAEQYKVLAGITKPSSALTQSLRGKSSRRRRGGAGLMTQFAGTMLEQSSLSQSYGKSQLSSQSQLEMASSTDNLAVDNSEEPDETNGSLLPPGQLNFPQNMLQTSVVSGFDDQVIEIELKDFNSTPAMIAMVRLLTRLHALCDKVWTANASPPKWVAELLKQLSSNFAEDVMQEDGIAAIEIAAKNKRVRLFFLRLVLNKPVCGILRKWAPLLLGPILKVVVCDLCSGDCPGLHYFLRDVVALFSDTWAEACAPANDEEADLASRLFTSLVERASHDKNEVIKMNLRAIRGLVEEWLSFGVPSKEVLQCRILGGIALEPIVNFMGTAFVGTGGLRGAESGVGMKAMRKRVAGLELLRIFLMTKGPILEVSAPGEASRGGLVVQLLETVLSCVAYNRKEVYEAGSLMCGTILKLLAANPRPGFTFALPLADFKRKVNTQLDKWMTKKDGFSAVAACLNAIVPNYPVFIERTLCLKMVAQVRRLKPRAKYEFLKAIFLSTGKYGDGRPITEMLADDWSMLLSDLSTVSFGFGRNRNNIPCVQLYSIKILSKNSDELSLELIEQLLSDKTLNGLSLATNEKAILQVREEAYNLLINICTKHPIVRLSLMPTEEQHKKHAARVSAVQAKVLAFLLKGITDPDSEGLEEIQSALKDKASRARAEEEEQREQERTRLVNAMYQQFDGAAGGGANLPVSADAALCSAPPSAVRRKRVGIRRKVLDFFSAQFGLHHDPFIRFHSLMRPPLFDPAFVDSWLNYTSYLMLSLCKTSIDSYTNPIFSHGLADDIAHKAWALGGASSKSSRLSSAPRFSLEVSQVVLVERARTAPSSLTASQRLAASQMSQFAPGFTQSRDVSQRMAGYLRATQDANWTQTQGAGGGLLPGQFRGDALRSQDAAFGTMFTQNYAATEVSAFSTSHLQLYVGGAGMGAGAGGAGDMAPPGSLPSWVVTSQRRTGRPAGQAGGSASNDFVSLNQLKGSASALGSSAPIATGPAKAKKAIVYRKYRDGELPDVQISHADILQPLQALCLRDSAVASGFFELIFESLYSDGTTPKEAGLRKCLLDMLEQTAGCLDTALIGGLLSSCHLCLQRETRAIAHGASAKSKSKPVSAALLLDLQTSVIADRALQTLNFHAGIGLLEEHIVGLERLLAVAPGGASGALVVPSERKGPAQLLQGAWRDLARLYEGLGDRDVMIGLATRMSRVSMTQSAIGSELTRDFAKAASTYEHLLNLAKIAETVPQLRQRLESAEQAAEGAAPDSHRVEAVTRSSELLDAAVQAQTECGIEGGDSAEEEMLLWSSRALECSRQLCDWNGLRNHADIRAGLLTGQVPRPFSSSDAMDEGGGGFDDGNGEEGSQFTLLEMLSRSGTVSAFQQSRLRDQVLPFYIRSLVGRGYKIPTAEEELRQFVALLSSHRPGAGAAGDEALAELKQAVESRHAADFAEAQARLHQWGRVRPLVDEDCVRFTRNWASLHPCAWQARRGLLQGLTRLFELDDAAKVKAGMPFVEATSVGGMLKTRWDTANQDLARRWNSTQPSPDDPLWVWDGVLRGRKAAFQLACKAIGVEDLQLIPPNQKTVLQLQSKLSALTASAAVHQGVLDNEFLQLHLKNSRNFQLSWRMQVQPEAKATWTADEAEVVLSYQFKVVERLLQGDGCGDLSASVAERSKSVDSSLNKLRLLFEQWDAEHEGVDQAKTGDVVFMQLKRAEWEALSFRVFAERSVNADAAVAGAAGPEMEFAERAQESFLVAMGGEPMAEAGGSGDDALAPTPGAETVTDRLATSSRAKAAGGLAKLCLTLLERSAPVSAPSHPLATLAMKAFTRGLRLGSSYCRDQLLQLLTLVGRFPDSAREAEVSTQLRALPQWIFLALAATLFGCLDKPEGPVVLDVLQGVALAYPAALHYPFRITRESSLAAQGKSLIQRLAPSLADASLDAFVEALSGLHHPELRWADSIKDLKRLAGLAERGDAKARQLMQARYQELHKSAVASEWEHVGTKIGSCNASLATKLRQKVNFDAIAGADGDTLFTSKKPLEIVAKLEQAYSKVAAGMPNTSGRVDLLKYSQWLADFDSSRHRIEVPGQYLLDANRPPQPERHVLVVSLDKQLLVMGSMRRPKRIKINGSGGVESLFLVKGGEDLRNDERVEQLFGLMNDIVAAEENGGERGAARGQNLRLRTYLVVPMTLSVGLLEWVSHTVPIKQIVTEELVRDADFCEKNNDFVQVGNNGQVLHDLRDIKASVDRETWVREASGIDSDITTEMYHKSFATNRHSAEQAFGNIVSQVPSDVLRRRLLRLAPSPECYLTLRAEFAKSLAMVSLCGFVLGIGDRHLDNLLLDTSSGSIVAIDFGVCFGIGAAMLPVPELIPFRLTGVLRHVLQPLDGKGLLRHYMVRVLTRLRTHEGAAALGARLEGYVNDPLMDWISLRDKDDKEGMLRLAGAGAGDAVAAKWAPRRRVEMTNRKLRGEHPSTLLIEDLEENHVVRSYKSIASLKCCVLEAAGLPAAAPPRKGAVLSPTEQVDELLRLATDPVILLFAYAGLATWI